MGNGGISNCFFWSRHGQRHLRLLFLVTTWATAASPIAISGQLRHGQRHLRLLFFVATWTWATASPNAFSGHDMGNGISNCYFCRSRRKEQDLQPLTLFQCDHDVGSDILLTLTSVLLTRNIQSRPCKERNPAHSFLVPAQTSPASHTSKVHRAASHRHDLDKETPATAAAVNAEVDRESLLCKAFRGAYSTADAEQA